MRRLGPRALDVLNQQAELCYRQGDQGFGVVWRELAATAAELLASKGLAG